MRCIVSIHWTKNKLEKFECHDKNRILLVLIFHIFAFLKLKKKSCLCQSFTRHIEAWKKLQNLQVDKWLNSNINGRNLPDKNNYTQEININ